MIKIDRSVLENMLNVIEDYRLNKIDLRNLVDSLEGSLSALEEKLPSEFYNDWYEHWGELEIILSLGIENARQEKISRKLIQIESLINNIINPPD